MGIRSDIDPDQIFSPFDLTSRRAVIAAVSGGSDSLAMLLLLQRWLERRAPSTRLIAATVDHGLRQSSAAEADAVGRFCAARGIAHRILLWTGDKPATGISVAARLARYGLLSGAATAEAGDIIVTGHTADDQAETVAMRQARGEGRGLSGMAPATLFDGTAWIVRPLLATGRKLLREFLLAEGVDWIEDPTNVDARYERPRIRAGLGTADEADTDRGGLLATARAAVIARVAMGARAAQLIEATVERPAPGLLRIAPDFFTVEDEPAVLALRVLLAVCGGVAQLPDKARVEGLLARLRAGPCRATLSRTVVDGRKAGVCLHRERRDLPLAGPAQDGAIWDGRYRLIVSQADLAVAPGQAVAAMGHDRHAVGIKGVPASILKALSATRPEFVDAAGLRVAADMASAISVLAPWRLFLPSFDLALAQAMARRIGAPKIPVPPLAGHNGQEG